MPFVLIVCVCVCLENLGARSLCSKNAKKSSKLGVRKVRKKRSLITGTIDRQRYCAPQSPEVEFLLKNVHPGFLMNSRQERDSRARLSKRSHSSAHSPDIFPGSVSSSESGSMTCLPYTNSNMSINKWWNAFKTEHASGVI